MSLRVLHVLDHSWPVLDGYSQRSRSIVTAQLQAGAEPVVITSPLHNLDDPGAADAVLDGIPYHRTLFAKNLSAKVIRGRWPGIREGAIICLLQRSIEDLLRSQTFDVIHAHSPALCGLGAWRAARKHRLPFVYEVRAFWEDAAAAHGTGLRPSARARATRLLETHVLRRADAVVGIAAGLLEDLQRRGLPPEKLFHVPNGVDSSRFLPVARDEKLAADLGVSNTPTLGFLGTLFPWEGVLWLVRAAAELARRYPQFKLLIVGDGAQASAIRDVIQKENAAGFISYLGRVEHREVLRYYSVMDVLVYPRVSLRITELVTPLKPLEAMAMGKAVLGSGVGGIRELVQSETTGLIFQAEDVDSFCKQAIRLLDDADLRCRLGSQARAVIAAERDWATLCQRYASVYDYAIRSTR